METRVIVGLGNPEQGYLHNRHNVGFLFADHLVRRWGGKWSKNSQRFSASTAELRVNDTRWLVVKPLTFMNRSGISVRKVVDYLKISVDHLLICYDDLDLPFAALRMRPNGSSGGHNGLKSVDSHLKGCPYPRLRLGIGREGRGESAVVRYVLSDFTLREQQWLEQVFLRAEKQVQAWSEVGVEKAMSWFNGQVPEQGDK